MVWFSPEPTLNTHAVHPDGVAGQGIADEVTNGVVCVQRQVGSDAGKTSGDPGLEAILPGIQRAQEFGGALAFAIGRGRSDVS